MLGLRIVSGLGLGLGLRLDLGFVVAFNCNQNSKNPVQSVSIVLGR